jgi:DNA-binding HxlR family transcriptional regulator
MGDGGEKMPDDLPELDPVIHGRLRLALLSLLLGAEEADFTWLRKKTGATDGNLSVQMQNLEVAGYVSMEKRFVGRKPQTLYRMTPNGRDALAKYLATLNNLLGKSL